MKESAVCGGEVKLDFVSGGFLKIFCSFRSLKDISAKYRNKVWYMWVEYKGE